MPISNFFIKIEDIKVEFSHKDMQDRKDQGLSIEPY